LALLALAAVPNFGPHADQYPRLQSRFLATNLERIAIQDLTLGRYVLVFQLWLFKQEKTTKAVLEREEEEGWA
jgi:hypothetical protein